MYMLKMISFYKFMEQRIPYKNNAIKTCLFIAGNPWIGGFMYS